MILEYVRGRLSDSKIVSCHKPCGQPVHEAFLQQEFATFSRIWVWEVSILEKVLLTASIRIF